MIQPPEEKIDEDKVVEDQLKVDWELSIANPEGSVENIFKMVASGEVNKESLMPSQLITVQGYILEMIKADNSIDMQDLSDRIKIMGISLADLPEQLIENSSNPESLEDQQALKFIYELRDFELSERRQTRSNLQWRTPQM